MLFLIIIMKFHHEEKFLKLFPKKIVRNPYIELPPYHKLANELTYDKSSILLDRDLKNDLSYWKKVLNQREFEVIDQLFGLTNESEKKTESELGRLMNLTEDEIVKIKTSALKKLQKYVHKHSINYISIPS